jgi:hypothetical protein
MAAYKKRPDFFTSEDGLLTLQILEAMDADNNFSTGTSYSANTTLYSQNLIPFVDKHMIYLRDHPNVNPQHYIANLRLMTKVR